MHVFCHVHREDRESRFLSSRMAIVAAFRSWSGKDFNVVIKWVISVNTSIYSTCYIHVLYFWMYIKCLSLYSGIINLCKAGNSGIQSLIGLLCIPNMEVRVSMETHAAYKHCSPQKWWCLFIPPGLILQPECYVSTNFILELGAIWVTAISVHWCISSRFYGLIDCLIPIGLFEIVLLHLNSCTEIYFLKT